MGRQEFAVLFPDAACESLFSGFLSGLKSDRRRAVVDAILSLETDSRPSGNAELNYRELDPAALKVFLRMLPGVPFSKAQAAVYSDYLYARHRVTVQDVTVVYAIDDAKKYVWLMGIRESA